jgi:hypothetical protein
MSKNLIYIVSVDHDTSDIKTSSYSDYCIKTWQHYCNRHNIDLVVCREHDERLGRPIWNKELIYKVGEDYDKIGIVDSDTMVKWNAPNVFNLYTDEMCGVVDTGDFRWLLKSLDNYGNEFFKDWKQPELEEYFNAGVLFFTNKHLDVFKQVFDFYLENQEELDNWNKGGGREQTILNYHIKKNGVKKKELLNEWNLFGIHKKDMFKNNWQLNIDQTPYFIKYAYVWHFTGFGADHRERLMKQTWEMIKHNYE